ncbi:Carboxylate-amine ligase ybdK [Pseudonocardia dioxanivorans CB1190]|uniref:Putative glutamate--cysteine ligase 2 n=1 Tax=Pseudonocardia dioxanivorans (strain ATCC 55486 / DSM 44775 / JCM 13855 / CB1190) TaxID=675635 RepID=F4CTV4_PSEUX|nr:Carboxylate-amine ligase ybdK [Pseudonocardia dioxanivorans CB1190]
MPGAAPATLLPVTVRTVGVEEEFLLLDPDSGRPSAVGGVVLRRADDDGPELTAELHAEQLETGTDPARTLDELDRGLRAARAAAASAAATAGTVPAAIATSPLPAEPTLSDGPRYCRMAERFGITVAESLTCGCHVHVAVSSDEEAVAALDRVRPWLAPLLALTANSPLWQGEDSGYSAYRQQVWSRWPSAGPTPAFGSVATYRETVETMVRSGTVLDEGMVYFDVRPSAQHPTLEIRVADVCRDPADAVLLAALARALVETAVRSWRAGEPAPQARVEVLRLASWRAARSGLDGSLLDPRTWRPAPAPDVLDLLLRHVGDALDEAGDTATVKSLLADVQSRGTGAVAQRAVLARGGDLRDVALSATL